MCIIYIMLYCLYLIRANNLSVIFATIYPLVGCLQLRTALVFPNSTVVVASLSMFIMFLRTGIKNEKVEPLFHVMSHFLYRLVYANW